MLILDAHFQRQNQMMFDIRQFLSLNQMFTMLGASFTNVILIRPID